jgi:hypothetical protein
MRRRLAFFGFLVIGCLYFLYLTRDSFEVENFVPAGQTYQIFAADIVGARDALAGSKILKAAPPEAGLGDLTASLAKDLGAPEWVLNNLVPSVCVLSGKDAIHFSDPLLVTRMTRVGCFLMRLHDLMPGVESESAGGLNLSQISKAGLHFATRGRILVLSLSRDALIRSLTLRDEDCATRESLIEMAKGTVNDDLVGKVRLNEAGFGAFDMVRFAVSVEPSSLRIKCSGALSEAYKARYDEALKGLTPAELSAPPDGILQVSMNFNRPLRELWDMGARLYGKPEAAEALRRKLIDLAGGDASIPVKVASGFIGDLGPGASLSWRGVDLNEIVPAPEIVMMFDANPEMALTMFAAMPPLAADGSRYTVNLLGENAGKSSILPQYDAEKKRVLIPLIGGPSMTPTIGVSGNELLISSSSTVADMLLAAAPSEQKLPDRANLYVALKPRACVETLTNFCALFAENHLLKGIDADKARRTTEPWLASASAVKEVAASLSCENGEVSLNVAVNGE